jgi:hypothetical protein
MPEVQIASFLNNATNTYFLGGNQVALNPFSEPTPPIAYVTGGLVLYMDSSVAASYPGTGTSWFNLVPGYPYTGSLQPNVSYVAPYLQTAASNGYITITTDSWVATPYTIMSATRYIGATRQRMLAATNNWLLGQWSATTENYFANGNCENAT